MARCLWLSTGLLSRKTGKGVRFERPYNLLGCLEGDGSLPRPSHKSKDHVRGRRCSRRNSFERYQQGRHSDYLRRFKRVGTSWSCATGQLAHVQAWHLNIWVLSTAEIYFWHCHSQCQTQSIPLRRVSEREAAFFFHHAAEGARCMSRILTCSEFRSHVSITCWARSYRCI